MAALLATELELDERLEELRTLEELDIRELEERLELTLEIAELDTLILETAELETLIEELLTIELEEIATDELLELFALEDELDPVGPPPQAVKATVKAAKR